MHLMKSILVAGSLALAVAGCSTVPQTAGDRAKLEVDVQQTISRMTAADSQVGDFLDSSYAYAVFPAIGTGGAGLGGGFGRGQAFREGEVVGYVSVTEGTIGAQIGGSNYSEIICFQDKWTFQKFASGEFAFQASGSAVAVEKGTGGNVNYSNGVIVFTQGYKGLKLQAAIGGQQFDYVPD